MAQLLFDALSLSGGISTLDSQTILAVQSFLDSQPTVTQETEANTDEDDVFLCGKCKKQFTSLPLFMAHKKEHCSNLNNSNYVVKNTNSATAPLITFTTSPNRQLNLPAQLQVPSSPLGTISNGNILLSEAEFLSLTASFDHLNSISNTTGQNNSIIQSNQPTLLTNKQLDSISLISNALINNPLLVTPPSQPMPGTSLLRNSVVNKTAKATNGANMVVEITTQETLQDEVENEIEIMLPDNHSISDELGTTQHEANEFETMIEDYEKTIGKPTTTTIKKVKKLAPAPTPTNSGAISTNFVEKKTKLDEELASLKTNNPKMSCDYCDKVFSKNFDLQQHIRCHTGEKPFQCVVCGRAFAQKSNVKKHLQTHKVWPDGLANTLPRKNDDIDHEAMMQNCNPVTLEPVSSAMDAKLVKVDKTYACPYCKFHGNTYFMLKTHMKEHKIEKVYKCILGTCGKMFNDLDSFLEHIKTHENEMTYLCHICNKDFQSLYELGAHQYSHSLYPNQGSRGGPTCYRCSSCLNKYSTQAALTHHMNTSNHNYQCPHCDKAFTCERYLRRHLHIHDPENTHICKQCGKGFKTDNYLRIHSLIHTGVKPYNCERCPAAFNRRDKLKRHSLVHDPVKRLKCPFRNHSGCLKEFNRKDKLKAHILTHSDPKAFRCRFCTRQFHSKVLLKNHEKHHEIPQEIPKDMPFKCTKCNSNFDMGKEHICIVARKVRAAIRYYRSGKNKKGKFKKAVVTIGEKLLPKKKGRPRKKAMPLETLVTRSPIINMLDDGIPTAHIEIITTDDPIDAANMSIQMCLQPLPLGSMQNNSAIRVIDSESMLVPESSSECIVSQQSNNCKDFDNIALTVTSSSLS